MKHNQSKSLYNINIKHKIKILIFVTFQLWPLEK